MEVRFVRIADELKTAFNKSAELCKMGDVTAMYDMALCMYDCCTEEQAHLIYDYETNPCKETLMALSGYMNRYKGDSFVIQYYMMWVVRSAMYGYDNAQTVVDKCSFYKEKAYLSHNFYMSGEAMALWGSNTLREIGLVDILQDKIDCRLRFDKRTGCFIFSYMSDYEPPDEDGYGSETEYKSVYYDEFFMKIDVKPKSSICEIEQALTKNEIIRNEYWKSQEGCAESRYKLLLSQ